MRLEGDNFGDCISLCCRVEREYRFTAFGQLGAAHMIELTADTGVLHASYALGVGLTFQINLQACVDGNLFVVLTDDVGVVNVVDRMHFKHGIVLTVAVEGLGACKL